MSYIEYDGIKFYKENKSGYYNKSQGERLHRYIWEKYNGKIKDGYHVHHIDGNKDNNSIENLQLITKKKHLKIHANTPEHLEKCKKYIEIARKYASVWHGSEEGKNFHKERYKISLKKSHDEIVNKICDCCGKIYQTDGSSKSVSRFCSNVCKSKWRRDNKIDHVTRSCVVCGNDFRCNKYEPTKTCSPKCHMKAMVKTRNGIGWLE
jgi:HNH endonuclease